MTIDEKIADLLRHDVSVQLDATLYKDEMTPYECILLYMISIGKSFSQKNTDIFDFKVLLFDFEDRIAVNQKFSVQNKTPTLNTEDTTNFSIHFVKDVARKETYYALQKKNNEEKAYFDFLILDLPIQEYSFLGISKIIHHIIDKKQLKKEHTLLNFDIVLHVIDFERGTWLIEQLKFA